MPKCYLPKVMILPKPDNFKMKCPYLRSCTDSCSFSLRNSRSSTMSGSSNFLASRSSSCFSTLHCTMATACSWTRSLSSGFSNKFYKQRNCWSAGLKLPNKQTVGQQAFKEFQYFSFDWIYITTENNFWESIYNRKIPQSLHFVNHPQKVHSIKFCN